MTTGFHNLHDCLISQGCVYPILNGYPSGKFPAVFAEISRPREAHFRVATDLERVDCFTEFSMSEKCKCYECRAPLMTRTLDRCFVVFAINLESVGRDGGYFLGWHGTPGMRHEQSEVVLCPGCFATKFEVAASTALNIVFRISTEDGERYATVYYDPPVLVKNANSRR